jgi:hypothetical protein
VWKELNALFGIKRALTTPFHPSSNGKAENAVKSVTTLLRCMANEHPKTWDEYLQPCVSAINSSINNSHGHTAHSLIYGREITNPIDVGLGVANKQPTSEIMEQMLTHQQYAQKMALHLHRERNANLKATYEEKVKLTDLREGDICYWRNNSLPNPKESKKFQLLFSGPYLICQAFPDGTLQLRHMHTGKFLPNRVICSQVKRANYMRLLDDLPASVIGMDNASNLGDIRIQAAPKHGRQQHEGEE